MSDYDLVVREGQIFDGTGREPYVADIAILNGKIANIGSIDSTNGEEISADGLMVMPGFVDTRALRR